MSQDPDAGRTDTGAMPAGPRPGSEAGPSTAAMPAAGRDQAYAASGETRYDPSRQSPPPPPTPYDRPDLTPGYDDAAADTVDTPVYARRVDGVAAVLLVLAGAATACSMLLPWVIGKPESGLDLVRAQRWEPWAVLIGGAVALLMGLLALLPLRSRRLVGLLALLGGLAIAAAVLRPIYLADWDTSLVDYGLALAAEAGGLALLGALKLLLTPRRKVPDVSA